jgi:hypothetical protein
MKQMLLGLFVACSMILQAQTFMINDFESATIGDSVPAGIKAAWSGAVVVEANPVISAVDSSAKVLKVINNGWVPVTIPVTLPAGKTWADYDGVRVKLCPLAGSAGDLTYTDVEIGLAANAWSEFKVGDIRAWSSATINTWYSVDIAWDPALVTKFTDSLTTTNLIVKYNAVAGDNVLYDDIQLIEHQDPAREVTLSFEDQILGTSVGVGVWYGTGFTYGVVANPVTDGINTSSKALEVTWPNGGGALAINILPANGDWHNYDYLSFKVLALAYDTINPWSNIFVGGGPDVWTGGTSQWSDTLGIHDLNKWYNVVIPIGSVANSTQPYFDFQAKSGDIFLLDDLSLMRNSTGFNTPKASTLNVARISINQYQVTIGSVSAYRLLNIEGREIKSGVFASGSNLLQVGDLASGIYLLQTTSASEKNVVKIIK